MKFKFIPHITQKMAGHKDFKRRLILCTFRPFAEVRRILEMADKDAQAPLFKTTIIRRRCK